MVAQARSDERHNTRERIDSARVGDTFQLRTPMPQPLRWDKPFQPCPMAPGKGLALARRGWAFSALALLLAGSLADAVLPCCTVLPAAFRFLLFIRRD